MSHDPLCRRKSAAVWGGARGVQKMVCLVSVCLFGNQDRQRQTQQADRASPFTLYSCNSRISSFSQSSERLQSAVEFLFSRVDIDVQIFGLLHV